MRTRQARQHEPVEKAGHQEDESCVVIAALQAPNDRALMTLNSLEPLFFMAASLCTR
jgi:hypothetical protein